MDFCLSPLLLGNQQSVLKKMSLHWRLIMTAMSQTTNLMLVHTGGMILENPCKQPQITRCILLMIASNSDAMLHYEAYPVLDICPLKKDTLAQCHMPCRSFSKFISIQFFFGRELEIPRSSWNRQSQPEIPQSIHLHHENGKQRERQVNPTL